MTRRRSWAPLLVLAGLASGCVSSPTAVDREQVRQLASPTATAVVGGALTGGAVDATTWASMLATVRHSVVRVRNQSCDGLAMGSGWAYGRRTLVTNAHVVRGARKLSVDTADGTPVDVTVANVATDEDLAVVHTAEDLPPKLTLASQDPTPGDLVEALGYPLGEQFKATQGRVVRFADGSEYGHTGKLIVSSAEIHPGNSGGPLLDRSGHVAGVVFALDLQDGSALAIPLSRLKEVLDRPPGAAAVGACPKD